MKVTMIDDAGYAGTPQQYPSVSEAMHEAEAYAGELVYWQPDLHGLLRGFIKSQLQEAWAAPYNHSVEARFSIYVSGG